MEIKNTQNVTFILDRLKKKLKIKSDTKLAEYLVIKPNTISNWRKRNSLDYALLIDKCEKEKIDLNLIFIDNNYEFIEEEETKTLDKKVLQNTKEIDSIKCQIEALKTLIKVEEELKDKGN